MEISIFLEIDDRMLQNMSASVRRELIQAVLKNGRAARDKAQEKCPKATGATAESIHVVHQQENGYTKATMAARALNPKIQFLVPEDVPSDPLECLVVCPAVNGMVLEHGGGPGHFPPRPFLAPSIAEQYAQFGIDISAAINKGIRDS
jgi:hypothetical protein